MYQWKQLGRSKSDQRGRIGFPLRQVGSKDWRPVHSVLEDDVAVNVDYRNGDWHAKERRL